VAEASGFDSCHSHEETTMFIPHGQRCEANHKNEGWGKYEDPADFVVKDKNNMRYICAEHYKLFTKEK
jgi:hypothetical protein